MTIKPWGESITPTTTLGNQLMLMQTEIDELREVLTNVCVTLERVQKERDDALQDALRYQWLLDNNQYWSWQPARYSQDIVSGFAHNETGYLGYSFRTAVVMAMENRQ